MKKNMRKLVAFFVITGLLSTVLAGCGGSGDEGQSAEAGAPAEATEAAAPDEGEDGGEGAASLTYITWNENQRDQIQATIDGFNEVYPDISVELQITPWGEYWTKLEAAATSGNMPDIVTMHTNTIAQYVNSGKFAALDDLAEYDESFSFDNYPEGVTKLYTFDGVHYGVPKDKDCVVLVYNTELFDEAGLAYPDETWTWEDLDKNAALLTDLDNRQYGIAAFNHDQEAWGNFLYQNGGSIIDEASNTSGLSDPRSIEAMEFYMSLNEKYSPDNDFMNEVWYVELFTAGNVAMQTLGNWELSYLTENELISDKFEIAPLPAGPDGTRATQMNGLALSIPADCKNMDAAKLFVAYASSEKGMTDAIYGPSIPAYNGVDAAWAEAHNDEFDTSVILDSMAYGVQFVGTESKTQWSAIMYDYIAKIFNGEMGVEEAFTEAAPQIDEILAREG